MISSPNPPKGRSKIVLSLLALTILSTCIYISKSIQSGAGNHSPPVFLKQSCKEIASALGPSSPLSSAQKDALWKQLKWQSFQWKLKVVDIVEGNGDYSFTGTFLCDPTESLLIDLEIHFLAKPNAYRANMLSWKRGRSYLIEGILWDYVQLTGIISAKSAESRPK